MTNRRAKIAAAATVVGLGALGGVALGSNPGMPTAAQSAARGGTAVVTGASGATATPVAQTVASGEAGVRRAPIVTRASGAPGAIASVDD